MDADAAYDQFIEGEHDYLRRMGALIGTPYRLGANPLACWDSMDYRILWDREVAATGV